MMPFPWLSTCPLHCLPTLCLLQGSLFRCGWRGARVWLATFIEGLSRSPSQSPCPDGVLSCRALWDAMEGMSQTGTVERRFLPRECGRGAGCWRGWRQPGPRLNPPACVERPAPEDHHSSSRELPLQPPHGSFPGGAAGLAGKKAGHGSEFQTDRKPPLVYGPACSGARGCPWPVLCGLTRWSPGVSKNDRDDAQSLGLDAVTPLGLVRDRRP